MIYNDIKSPELHLWYSQKMESKTDSFVACYALLRDGTTVKVTDANERPIHNTNYDDVVYLGIGKFLPPTCP